MLILDVMNNVDLEIGAANLTILKDIAEIEKENAKPIALYSLANHKKNILLIIEMISTF